MGSPKRDVKHSGMNSFWLVKSNTGLIADVQRDGITRKVIRPEEMSRAEFFRRLEPGSYIAAIDLHARFKGWSAGHGVVEW
jgi:hypothetical protein